MPGTALGPSLMAPAVRYSLDRTCCDGWGSGNGLTPTNTHGRGRGEGQECLNGTGHYIRLLKIHSVCQIKPTERHPICHALLN